MTWASLLTSENFEDVLDLLELNRKLAGTLKPIQKNHNIAWETFPENCLKMK